jgi:hypothetical protein
VSKVKFAISLESMLLLAICAKLGFAIEAGVLVLAWMAISVSLQAREIR